MSVLVEPPRLDPDFATSFSLDAEDPEAPVGVAVVNDGEEVSERDAPPDAFFAPRNVLFTDTDLKL